MNFECFMESVLILLVIGLFGYVLYLILESWIENIVRKLTDDKYAKQWWVQHNSSDIGSLQMRVDALEKRKK